MPNRKNKSGGQSQGPKQSAGGGAPRASHPQPTNNSRSGGTAHPKANGNAFVKPPASPAATPRPPQPQPQATAHRPANGAKHQNGGNGPPRSQSANNSNFVRAGATSGHRTSQVPSVNQGAPKRNGNGINNGPLPAQGHAPQPNSPSRNEAPKPRSSQSFFGGHSSTTSSSNSGLPSPTRSGNVQHSHVPKVNVATVHGNKAIPPPTQKQNGHTQPPAQRTQNHAPTPPKPSPAYQQQPGKNASANNGALPKVQVATPQTQHPSRGAQGQPPARPAQASERPSHTSQQQHRAPAPHSPPMQETFNKGRKDAPPKPTMNKGNPPAERLLSSMFSLFSTGSGAPPGNQTHRSQNSQQGKVATPAAPPNSRPAQETSNKGHKNTPTKHSVNDRGHGHGHPAPANEGVFPKALSSFFSTEATPARSGGPSHNPQQAQHKATPPQSRPGQEIHNKGGKDTSPKTQRNNERKGKLPVESLLPMAIASFLSGGPDNPTKKPQHAQHHKNHKNNSQRPPKNDQTLAPSKNVLPVVPQAKGTGNRSVNPVTPPPQATKNPAAVASGTLNPQATKNQRPNLAKGSANVTQASAAKPQTWGEMFSSWFSPSAPPVTAQATNKLTPSSMKAKVSSPKPKGSSATQANDTRPKPHPIPDMFFVPRENLRKEPIVSASGAKSGLQDLQNQVNDNPKSPPSVASPKKDKAATHHDILKQSGGGQQHPLRVSEKSGTAPTLISASSQAAGHSRTSSKPQAAAEHHLKQFKVRSSSSKVLAHHEPQVKAAVRKVLLRQRAPTLRWRESDKPKVTSAYSTLNAAPLPSPPNKEHQNKVVRQTIAENPELFKIVSPINVGAFEGYVKDHPNQRFVKSVARSIKKGFWPWADTSDPSFPTTHDGSRQGSRITDKDKVKFIRQQSEDEMQLERWSKPFGSKLLPGMHSAPISAVPKSTPGEYRLIVDQSRGPHALNSTIPKSQVNVKLDTIHDLGNQLLAARKKYPNRKLDLFKSDVKSAYRQLPMHPLWQIKQAVPIDGQFHIDRCNTFGNRGGGWNWDSFASSVNWIASEKKGVTGLLGYVDDNFGWEFARNRKFYKPYNKYLPTKQTRLLELWDELGIPHDEKKQQFGPALPILGYHVDANAMSVKVPDDKKAKIVNLLRSNAKEGKSYTVNELQSVAGSVGGALSLYPNLRPGLQVLFDEMTTAQEGGKRPGKLQVTKPVARTLDSLADFLERAPPVPIRYQKERVRAIGSGSK